MKIFYSVVVAFFLLFIFTTAPLELVENSSETLSEKVYEEKNLESDTFDGLSQEYNLCFLLLEEKNIVAENSNSSHQFLFFNTPLRPPIVS
jgi:hypothetical protein